MLRVEEVGPCQWWVEIKDAYGEWMIIAEETNQTSANRIAYQIRLSIEKQLDQVIAQERLKIHLWRNKT